MVTMLAAQEAPLLSTGIALFTLIPSGNQANQDTTGNLP
jgi:hypothetical protein